jgi:hypothetical protein
MKSHEVSPPRSSHRSSKPAKAGGPEVFFVVRFFFLLLIGTGLLREGPMRLPK